MRAFNEKSCAYTKADARESMAIRTHGTACLSVAVVTTLLLSGELSSVRAQTTTTSPPPQTAQTTTTPPESKTRMEIYGFTMLDAIFDFEKNNPDWFDTMRPT
jgi:hypothetical protein